MKHILFLCLLSGKKVTKKVHVVLIIKRSQYYTCLRKYTEIIQPIVNIIFVIFGASKKSLCLVLSVVKKNRFLNVGLRRKIF